MMYGHVVDVLNAETARHQAAFGSEHGFRFVRARRLDIGPADFCMISLISGPSRAAFLFAPANDPLLFKVDQDTGRRQILTDADPFMLDDIASLAALAEAMVRVTVGLERPRLLATSDDVLEELAHKILSGLHLVHFREAGPGSKEYTIRWPDGELSEV